MLNRSLLLISTYFWGDYCEKGCVGTGKRDSSSLSFAFVIVLLTKPVKMISRLSEKPYQHARMKNNYWIIRLYLIVTNGSKKRHKKGILFILTKKTTVPDIWMETH